MLIYDQLLCKLILCFVNFFKNIIYVSWFFSQRACSSGYEIDPNSNDADLQLLPPDSSTTPSKSSSQSKASSTPARGTPAPVSRLPHSNSARQHRIKFGLTRGLCVRCGSLLKNSDTDARAFKAELVPALSLGSRSRTRQLRRAARRFLKCPTDASASLRSRLHSRLALSVPRLVCPVIINYFN